MDIVETPRMTDDYIAEGNVVLISLDPVASVAGLQDEEATLEASVLPKGKYLAVVDTFHGFDMSKHVSEMPLEFSFFSVGRRVPEPAFACVALSPDAACPEDRQPVIPSPPLRWPNCRIYTLRCFYARIARVHLCKPPSVPTAVTEEQRMDINRAVIGDQMDTCLPMRDADGEIVRVPLDDVDDGETGSRDGSPRASSLSKRSSSHLPSTSSKKSARAPSVHESAARIGQGTSAVQVDQEPSDDDSSVEEEETREPLRAYAYVEVWLDLASAADFDEPDQLMHSIRRLLQIERDSANRRVLAMLADQPQTARWAEDVADAKSANLPLPGSDAPTVDPIAPPHVPAGHANGGPGDARAGPPPGSENKRGLLQLKKRLHRAVMRVIRYVPNLVRKVVTRSSRRASKVPPPV